MKTVDLFVEHPSKWVSLHSGENVPEPSSFVVLQPGFELPDRGFERRQIVGERGMAFAALHRFAVDGERAFDPCPGRLRTVALEQKFNALGFLLHGHLG